jgi:RHS repeat-associated protein
VISPTDEEVMQYAADPALGTAGKRRRRQTGAGTTRFVWDDENLLLETDDLLALLARYTDYPGYWGGLASMRRSGASSHYAFDHQGNTRALLSPAQAVTDEYWYTAFGEDLAGIESANTLLRFTGLVGYLGDSVTRLYVRARHLSPSLGRWLARDPIASDWPYAYVGSNPVRRRDPSGLQGQDPRKPMPCTEHLIPPKPKRPDAEKAAKCLAAYKKNKDLGKLLVCLWGIDAIVKDAAIMYACCDLTSKDRPVKFDPCFNRPRGPEAPATSQECCDFLWCVCLAKNGLDLSKVRGRNLAGLGKNIAEAVCDCIAEMSVGNEDCTNRDRRPVRY